MKKIFLIVLSSVFALFVSNCFAKADQAIQDAMNQFIEDYHITGAMVSVNVPGEHEIRDYFAGSALHNKHIPLNSGHLMMAASNTKSFVAAVFLNQLEAGLISLDQTVGDFLSKYPEWSNITMRQLLNHSSGIFNYTDSDEFKQRLLKHPKDNYDRDSIIDLAAKEAPYFEPGKGWHYSNTNYLILADILEKVTHKTMVELLSDSILTNPEYNLKNSFYFHHMPTQDVFDREAHGYYYMKNGFALDVTGFTMSVFDAAGGIISNSHDLVKWYEQLFDGNVLSPTAKHSFKKVVSKKDGAPIDDVSSENPNGYGLGIESSEINGHRYYWHSGGAIGYKSITVYSEDSHLIFSIMFNRVDQGQEAHAFEIYHPFVQKLMGLLET